MAFVEKEEFEGTVQAAAFVTSPEKGTGGLSIIVATAEGPIDRTWWLSANSVGFVKDFLAKAFGITEEQLQDETFIEGGVGEFLKGKPCSVRPELAKDSNGNIYKDSTGRTRWTIQFLNPSRLGKKVTGASTKKIASLFGGSSGSASGPPPQDWNDASGAPGEDVPF